MWFWLESVTGDMLSSPVFCHDEDFWRSRWFRDEQESSKWIPAVWNVNSCHLVLVQVSWGNSDLMFLSREMVVMYPRVGCSKGETEISVDQHGCILETALSETGSCRTVTVSCHFCWTNIHTHTHTYFQNFLSMYESTCENNKHWRDIIPAHNRGDLWGSVGTRTGEEVSERMFGSMCADF